MKIDENIAPQGTYCFKVYCNNRRPIMCIGNQRLPIYDGEVIKHELMFIDPACANNFLRIGKAINLELRSAQALLDVEPWKTSYKALWITERAVIKQVELGRFTIETDLRPTSETNSEMSEDEEKAEAKSLFPPRRFNPVGTKVILEVTNLLVTADGNELIYIDKLNGRHRVNGIEQNAEHVKLL